MADLAAQPLAAPDPALATPDPAGLNAGVAVGLQGLQTAGVAPDVETCLATSPAFRWRRRSTSTCTSTAPSPLSTSPCSPAPSLAKLSLRECREARRRGSSTTSAAAWCARATHHPGDPRAFPHLCAPCPRLKHAPACLHADLVVAHHAARSRGHWLAARVRAVGAPVGARGHPQCLSTHMVHAAGAATLGRAAPRLSRAPLLAHGLPLSSLLAVAARTACGHTARGICISEALHVTHGPACTAHAAIGSEMGEILRCLSGSAVSGRAQS